MDGARNATLALVAPVSARDLERVISPIMSPLAWDLGHIAAYEDLWLAHRCGGRELLEPELADLYDAAETPRAVRGEIEALGADAAVDYLSRVRARTRELAGPDSPAEELVWEMVLRHELQHCETMRQTLVLGGLLDERGLLTSDPAPPQWLEIPGGRFTMGSGEHGFAYDNERPAFDLELGPLRIASRPATNRQWLEFSADGGYSRRELWSEAGWDWAREAGAAPDRAIERGDPDASACHVCWHEAQAFARWSQARLPTEREWERAARLGDGRFGALGLCGEVWEWTATEFDGYSGFTADPYPEYSQVFFRRGYRVLRGGSWATDPRVKGPTFRNWDLPARRQIFAGVRLARDAA